MCPPAHVACALDTALRARRQSPLRVYTRARARRSGVTVPGCLWGTALSQLVDPDPDRHVFFRSAFVMNHPAGEWISGGPQRVLQQLIPIPEVCTRTRRTRHACSRRHATRHMPQPHAIRRSRPHASFVRSICADVRGRAILGAEAAPLVCVRGCGGTACRCSDC